MVSVPRLPATVLIVGLLLGITPGAGSAAGSRHTLQTLVEANCSGGQVRPRSIVLACGDGAAVAVDLVWTVWTRTHAMATGIVSQDNCDTGCGTGQFISYPASLVLSERVVVKGRDFFARLTITYNNKSPFGHRVEVRKDCYDNPLGRPLPRCPADLQNAV